MNQLTDEERFILDKTAELWKLFLKLPVQHPMHQQEFANSLHQLQRMIMARPIARAEGWTKE